MGKGPACVRCEAHRQGLAGWTCTTGVRESSYEQALGGVSYTTGAGWGPRYKKAFVGSSYAAV
jgi:hypothetical protein